MFMPKNQKRRPRSTCTQRLNLLLMVFAAGLFVTTCGLHKDMTQSPLHEGHITIPMTALDRDGNVYHLAQAKVWVAGPVHGEATLDRQISDVFRRALPSGRYTFGISGPVTLLATRPSQWTSDYHRRGCRCPPDCLPCATR